MHGLSTFYIICSLFCPCILKVFFYQLNMVVMIIITTSMKIRVVMIVITMMKIDNDINEDGDYIDNTD